MSKADIFPTIDAIKERLSATQGELVDIIGILELMSRDHETPIASAVQWFIPKLDDIANTLDRLRLDLYQAMHSPEMKTGSVPLQKHMATSPANGGLA